MDIRVHRAEFKDVEALRELNRQVIYDSILPRGMADPYVIGVEGRVGGYGGVWNRLTKDRLMEFYTLPRVRSRAQEMFRELLTVSQAKEIEAQTNMPLMLTMLFDGAKNIVEEAILFEGGEMRLLRGGQETRGTL